MAFPKVGIDFDGVIADTLSIKSANLRSRFGIDEPSHRMIRSYVEAEYGAHVYEQVKDDTWDALTRCEPVIRSVEVLNRLRGVFDVCVLTARDRSAIPNLNIWLNRNGLTFLSRNIIAERSIDKLKVCEEIGCIALIDNDPRHLDADHRGPNVDRILFNEPLLCGGSKTFNLVTQDWLEVENYLSGIAS